MIYVTFGDMHASFMKACAGSASYLMKSRHILTPNNAFHPPPPPHTVVKDCDPVPHSSIALI